MIPLSPETAAARDDLILQLWNAGAPLSRIRARAGCGSETVGRTLARLGAAGRTVAPARRGGKGYVRWTAEGVEAARRLWLAGESAKAIGEALGVSRNAVIGKLNRLGVGRPEEVNRQNKGRAAQLASTAAAADAAARAADLWARSPGPARRRARPAESLSPTAALVDLGRHACRWPIGEPGDAGFGFCGRAAARTYCSAHGARAYAPPPLVPIEVLAGLAPATPEGRR